MSTATTTMFTIAHLLAPGLKRKQLVACWGFCRALLRNHGFILTHTAVFFCGATHKHNWHKSQHDARKNDGMRRWALRTFVGSLLRLIVLVYWPSLGCFTLVEKFGSPSGLRIQRQPRYASKVEEELFCSVLWMFSNSPQPNQKQNKYLQESDTVAMVCPFGKLWDVCHLEMLLQTIWDGYCVCPPISIGCARNGVSSGIHKCHAINDCSQFQHSLLHFHF